MESIARSGRVRGFSGVVLLISTILVLVNVVDQLIKNMCSRLTGGLEILTGGIAPIYARVLYGKVQVIIHLLANPFITYTLIIAFLTVFNVYLMLKYGCCKSRFDNGLKMYYKSMRSRLATYTYIVDEETLYYMNICIRE